MNKEFLRFQVLSGIIAESEYKAKLEENVDANAASEEAKELLKDPKEMADIEAELGSLSESEGEEKRTKLQTALRLAGYGAIAGLLGTVPLAALAGASLKAILLAAAAGKLGGAATALTVGLAGEKEQRESLNENFVGMGMVGNIFDREKTDYELAFEHFTKGTSLNEVEEDLQQTDVKSAIDGKQLDLDKLKDATEKAMKGDSTDLTLFLAGVFESKGLEESEELEEGMVSGLYTELKNVLFPYYTDLTGEERVTMIDDIISELNAYIGILQGEKTVK